MKTTIGLGFDVHPLKKKIPLFIGGVEIPFKKGLAGHSDGDCLIHALIDALLGALGEQDIGQLFPDTDEAYRNIRSIKLLREVSGFLRQKKARIMHVDSVVLAEAPKLAPFIPAMKEKICAVLNLNADQLGIKAKTSEKMGVIGRGKAISAIATALLAFPE